MKTLNELAAALASGAGSARSLVEACLENIADQNGEGPRAFIEIHDTAARQLAEAVDAARRHNAHTSPYAGIPISIKDLFDMRGQVTRAGSLVLADAEPARDDAPAVARLRAAGFIIMGRANMTEFAYSGLGVNINFPTPKNPYDRETGRIPGGSSSGGAVSVADGMAYATLGTDTGGSCRIPAALCGIVGFKPTAARVPLDGAVPLSSSLDSIGPLANSVSCCALLDALLAAGPAADVATVPLAGLRLALPQSFVLDGMDDHVARSFEAAVAKLSDAGVQISEIPLSEFLQIPEVNRKGGLAASESFAWHQPLLRRHGNRYDPWIKARIEFGAAQSAADYIELLGARRAMMQQVSAITRDFDAVILPTVPIIAPAFSELQYPDEAGRINLLLLRNPAIANFLDRTAISLPCHEAGSAPVGLMLMGETGTDRRLLSIAAAVEAVVTRP